MTSWSDLEVYLAGLVKSVGGGLYVLRDSGGRHLAPRPPERGIDIYTMLDGAPRSPKTGTDFYTLLNSYFEGHVDQKEVVQVLDERRVVLNERRGAFLRKHRRIARVRKWFEQHSAALEQAVGPDFVTKGPGKRYVHRSPELPFIAERLLSSYLLLIAFKDVEALDQGGILMTLERARSTLGDMLGDLPPDDGGKRALSNAQRPA